MVGAEPRPCSEPRCPCWGWRGGDARGVAEDDVGRDLQRPDLRDDVVVEVPAREVLLGRAGSCCPPRAHLKAPQTLGLPRAPLPAHRGICWLNCGSEALGHPDEAK